MSKKKDKDDLLKEIKDRFKLAHDAINQHYQLALEDLNFANGEQWPTDLKTQRDVDGRPCLVINKIPTFCDQVIGDIRQNGPSIKIKPVDSKGDPETAEVLGGLIRNIETQSDAEIAYDTAAENMVYCGYGSWRVNTEYTQDDRFEQDIVIKRIKNPFTVYWDPSAQEWDKSDARFCFVTEKYPKDEFERLFPNAKNTSFSAGFDRDHIWNDGKNVRVVEYFKRELEKKTIYLVSKMDPMTGMESEPMMTEVKPDFSQLDPNVWRIIKEREVESAKITWYKATDSEILEGPTVFHGKYIPIISIFGKEIQVEGTTHVRGLVRNAKDPQRLYNYSRSTGAEVISLAPKAPYLVTAKMIGNYQALWNSANKRSLAYLPYEIDPADPSARPARSSPIEMNTGIQNEVMVADQEMHDTTGLQQASLGKKSNEKSGRAILARQREGDVANYAYYDNLARGIKHTGRILVGLIPHVYDTARIVRVLNRDGADKFVPVNQPFVDPKTGMEKIFDLTVGKYDVVVTIGPSFSTEREEAAASMIDFVNAVPSAGPLVADLIAKNLDWPGAEEISKRLKLLLPPQLQGDGEGQGTPPPAPPDPMQQMALQMMMKEKAAGIQGKEIENETAFEKLQRMKRGLPPEPKEPKPVSNKGK